MTVPMGATTGKPPSFCGPLGFGPIQPGGLLTPCFNDIVLFSIVYIFIIPAGAVRIVRLSRQPPFRNPRYIRNFWTLLDSVLIFVLSVILFILTIVYRDVNSNSLAYVLVRGTIECIAWVMHLTLVVVEVSRFVPHCKALLYFDRLVLIPSTVKLYGILLEKYGSFQTIEKVLFYLFFGLICYIALRSLLQFYFSFGRRILDPLNLKYDSIPAEGEIIEMNTPRRYMENWAGTITVSPIKLFCPKSVDEIIRIVNISRQHRCTVRVIGSVRCNNPSFVSNEFILSLQKFDKIDQNIQQEGEDEYHVTVGAGKNLLAFFQELKALDTPLCLPATDDLWDHTVGGAVMTGRHGTGRLYPGTASYVVGMEMVTGKGEILKIGERDEDLLNAARNSLGYLGIVYSVTFKLKKNYNIEQVKRGANVDKILRELPRLLVEEDHFEIYYFPHTSSCQTVARHIGTGAGKPSCWKQFLSWYGKNFFLLNLNRFAQAFPKFTPRILWFQTNFLNEGNDWGDTSIIQSNEDPIQRFYEAEFALPFDQGLDAFRELRDLIEQAKHWDEPYYCNQSISIRFSQGESNYLSPIYLDKPTTRADGEEWKPDFMWIAFYSYDMEHNLQVANFFVAVKELLVTKYDGRPHWAGAMPGVSAKQRASRFPKFDRFAKLAKKYDPDGVFKNYFLSDALTG